MELSFVAEIMTNSQLIVACLPSKYSCRYSLLTIMVILFTFIKRSLKGLTKQGFENENVFSFQCN